MKNLFSFITITLFLSLTSNVWGWGMIGHRVVGEVAGKHLTEKAKANIKRVLGNKTLAEVSNFMDDIKSDNQIKYDTLNTYHYVSIPDGMKYEDTNINPKGDIVIGLNFVIAKLKSGELDIETEEFYLKILVHLMGDIHQPLHVGRADDVGGNAIRFTWFGQKSNLHKVWDSEIINGKLYSYTELTEIINHPSTSDVVKWQNDNIDDWIAECMALRPDIYDFDETSRYWEYKYMYKHWKIVKQQLLKGGVRLAGILNEIYS